MSGREQAQKTGQTALRLNFETLQAQAWKRFLNRKNTKYRKREACSELSGALKMNSGTQENEFAKRSMISRIYQNYKIGGLRKKESKQIRDSPNCNKKQKI